MAWRETFHRLAPAIVAVAFAATPARAQQSVAVSQGAMALKNGIANRLDTALAGLENDRRAEAVMAIDEAHRVLTVGAYVEAATGPFAEAEQAVKDIRRLLQNGRADKARQRLDEVRAGFAAAEATEFRPVPVSDAYEGATLVDAQGKVLGEFGGIGAQGDGSAVIGDWQDTLGFIDIGGEKIVVPRDRLIFGPPGTWGKVFVVLTE